MRPTRRFARNAGSESGLSRTTRHDVALVVEEHVARRCFRCDFTRVDHGLEAIRRAMEQPESAAAESRAAGLYDCERGADSHRRIEGIAALLQDLHAGLSCQLVLT